MDTCHVKALYLFIVLLFVQAERGMTDAASEDFDEDWKTVQTLDDLFGNGRDLQQSRASPPDPGPSNGFEAAMNEGIGACRDRNRLPRCQWRNGYTVTGTTRTYRQQVTERMCCCACRVAGECDAIHYERLDGGCVFHQGPTQRDRPQRATKRWIKR